MKGIRIWWRGNFLCFLVNLSTDSWVQRKVVSIFLCSSSVDDSVLVQSGHGHIHVSWSHYCKIDPTGLANFDHCLKIFVVLGLKSFCVLDGLGQSIQRLPTTKGDELVRLIIVAYAPNNLDEGDRVRLLFDETGLFFSYEGLLHWGAILSNEETENIFQIRVEHGQISHVLLQIHLIFYAIFFVSVNDSTLFTDHFTIFTKCGYLNYFLNHGGLELGEQVWYLWFYSYTRMLCTSCGRTLFQCS